MFTQGFRGKYLEAFFPFVDCMFFPLFSVTSLVFPSIVLSLCYLIILVPLPNPTRQKKQNQWMYTQYILEILQHCIHSQTVCRNRQRFGTYPPWTHLYGLPNFENICHGRLTSTTPSCSRPKFSTRGRIFLHNVQNGFLLLQLGDLATTWAWRNHPSHHMRGHA